MGMNDERDNHVRNLIKSNLVGFNLATDLIEKITDNLCKDILDLFDEFEAVIVHELLNEKRG